MSIVFSDCIAKGKLNLLPNSILFIEISGWLSFKDIWASSVFILKLNYCSVIKRFEKDYNKRKMAVKIKGI